jgi:hypothetical protein
MSLSTASTARALAICLVIGTTGTVWTPAQQDGSSTPQVTNPAPFRPGQNDVPVFRDPRADQVLQEMIEAHGGEDRIAGRRTIYLKYEITNFGYPEPAVGTLTIWFKRPSQMRQEIAYAHKKRTVVFDGERAWMDDGGGPQDLGPHTARIVKRGIRELDTPLLIYREGSLKYLSTAKDPLGRLTQKLSWRHEGYARELMVDVTTSRLTVIGHWETPAGPVSRMQILDDYRSVEGIMIPHFKMVLRNDQKHTETKILEVRFNGTLDEGLFQPLGSSTATNTGASGSASAGSPD